MNNILTVKLEKHKVPEFKEIKNKDWVYYGDKNDYPEYLIELYLRSPIHNAIINAKVNYIYGGGLVSQTKGVSIGSEALTNEFIRQLESQDFLRRMILDFELFNGLYIQPIYNKGKSKILSINYIPFSKIRISKEEDKYYYSNDWSEKNQSPEKTGLKVFYPYNPKNKSENQLLCYKLLSPKNGKDRNVYPVPDYIGANTSIETDIEINNFHLNNSKAGFSIGTIINFNNGKPSDEAKEKIEDQIKEKFQGTDRAGSVLLTFNDSSENAPTITSFQPNDLDKQFIEISKKVEQAIFTGHKITSPMLFGVKTEGQLGGRNEMIDAFELLQNTYIDVRQTYLEKVINKLGEDFGLTSKVHFKRTQAVQRNLPDAIVQKVYDAYPVEQLAEIMGLPPIKKVIPVRMESQKDLYEVLFECEWKGENEEDILNNYRMTFAKELNANERAIVDLLTKEPLTPSEAISKALKISVAEVNEIINYLDDAGYLEISGDEKTPTKAAEKVVEEEGAKTESTEIRYRYDWRPNVKKDDNSRDFCKEMLTKTSNQSGWMTRQEIENLDNEQGLPVWDSRGGWWNKNGANLPYCRHLWYAMVVKKK